MELYDISTKDISVFDLVDVNVMVSPLEICTEEPFHMLWFNKKNLQDSKFPSLDAAVAHPFKFPEKFIIELKQKFNDIKDKGYSNLVSTRYNDDGSVVTAYFNLVKIKFNKKDAAIWVEQTSSNEKVNSLSSVILRYINQPIIVFDNSGKNTFLSPEAYRIFKKIKSNHQILEIIKLISTEDSKTSLKDLTSKEGFYKTFHIHDENDTRQFYTLEINNTINPADGSDIYISVFTNITNIINHEKVLESKNEIENILSNIHQGIFKIDRKLNIVGHYSKYLEEILETNDINNKNIADLIFKKSNLSDIKPAVNALKSISDNSWEFELNAHHLPKKLIYMAKSKEKHLNIDWIPLFSDTSFLICVRDESHLVYLEKEASKKEEASKKLLKIISMGREKFSIGLGEVEDLTHELLKVMDESLKNNQYQDHSFARKIFRYLHTIKGNCNTLELKKITDLAHKAESIVLHFIDKEGGNLDFDLLRSIIDKIVKELNEYALLLKDFFSNIKAENKYKIAVENIKSIIEFEVMQNDSNIFGKSIKLISGELFSLEYTSLKDVLELEIAAMKKNAIQLNKTEPSFDWKNIIWVPRNKINFFRNIFSHILRNSIVHGIETPSLRKKHGKNEAGKIEIKAIYKPDKTIISFQDDGLGLNLKELRTRSPEQGKSNLEIANLIFKSGVSTSVNISELSGRGVGMDAVREFIRKEGGDIQIDLFEEKSIDQVHIPFKYIISFPFVIHDPIGIHISQSSENS